MRTIPPFRRPNITRSATWNGHDFTVTIGLDPVNSTAVEVFADTARGGDMAPTLADACIIISIALQGGISPSALAKSIARVPVLWAEENTSSPASPIGAILEAIQAEDPR
jgi:hypothetical protein